MIRQHPPIQQVGSVTKDGEVYADCVNHCQRWREALVRGSRVSSSHEMTHFINAEARNKQGVGYATRFVQSFAASAESGDGGAPLERLPIREPFPSDGKTTFTNVNCLYLLDNQLVVVPEPAFRKRAVAAAIPKELRESRFRTYITGQESWDDTPLYVWDEWVAYINGAKCAEDLYSHQRYDEGNRDILMGVLEFTIYGTALMQVASKADPAGHHELLPSFVVILSDAISLFLKTATHFPWSTQMAYFEAFRSGQAGKSLRDYLKSIGYRFPPDRGRRHVIL
jgi:hypothetical protein